MPSPSATKPPAVFLAFSGVAVGNYMPLPRLADEAAQLRTVFRAAKRAGQCELELLENATLTQILDIFQDPDLHGRIAVFHYAGHADSYSLLLQEAKGEDLLAHAGGLAAFLAQQPGLQLAFLNGCSTEAQVADLHAAGVPAVVATSVDVVDDWAEQFAVRFYKGLAGGATIAEAFGAAQAEIEARHGKQAEWPWRLHLRREEAGAWRLATRAAPTEEALSAEGQPSTARGKLLARTLAAIQGAYSRDELRRALHLGMNENLEALVADKPFEDQVFQLLEWAERRNRLKELVACLHEYNSDNKPLALVYEEVVGPQMRTARPVAKPETPPITAPTPDLAVPPVLHPDGGRHVFLAYSRKDADLMHRLRADLLAAGIAVWVDDQDLEPGTLLWQRAIQRAIRESHCLIALLSPEACESEWVNSEITLAKKRNLRIFPVLLRGDEDDAVPLALVSVQYVDARSDYASAVQGRLLPAVQKHLRSKIPDKAASAGGLTQGQYPETGALLPASVAVSEPAGSDMLLPAKLHAVWAVNWSCNSDRCAVKQCGANVVAQVTRAVSNGYLPVEHQVTWADECFDTQAWTVEVDQATGQERSGKASDNFLYGYWLGTNPGEANGVLPLDDDRSVVVFCSEPQKVEIEEGGGWTTVYEGSTCHDVKTGMLVYMKYVKRWLYTGGFEGKTYDRAYFGDSEELEQRLIETNVALGYAHKRL